MKRYLLPKEGKFYKANLHCHTRISDGGQTPQEIKRDYAAQGYSAVAFTDHDVLIPHNDLTDETFIALNGLEYAVSSGEKFGRCCHFCAVALDPETTLQPLWHEERYYGAGNSRYFRVLVDRDRNAPDYVREYTREGVSDMMKKVRDAGFFVTYNHPGWSRESALEWRGYEGMHAMEISNFGSRCMGGPEYCPQIYDDMLLHGKRIACVATDDNHNTKNRFGGFTMIRAPKLEYRALTDALVKGDYYASQGPEILELTYEDGEIRTVTSPARSILFTFGFQRYARGSYAPEGETVTEACATVPPDAKYVRLTVEDEKGRHANSRAYFLEELEGEEH